MSKSSYVVGNRLGKRVVWISGAKGAITSVKADEPLDVADLLNHGGECA